MFNRKVVVFVSAVSILLILASCTNQMVADLGGTPQLESSKFFTAVSCGVSIDKNDKSIEPYITMKLHDDAPEPLYLVVNFETPEGIKIVNHQITKEEYSNKVVDIVGPVTNGWKLAAYNTIVEAYTDRDHQNLVDSLDQPWRQWMNLDKILND